MQIIKRFWGIVSLGIGVVMGLISGQVGYAATNAPANNIGFSVSAQLPSNQLKTGQSYFDLKMQSGQKQTLKAVIYNSTKRDIKVRTNIRTAYTNQNGAIEYITAAKTFDPSLKFSLAKLTKIDGNTVVTVPANGTKTVTAKVKMPTTDFQGVLLGGWNFEKVDEQVTGHVDGAMNVRNQYAYMIAMKYTLGKVPAPKLLLAQVKPGVDHGHQTIFPILRNVSAVIVPKLTLKTKITDRKTGKLVKQATKHDVRLAPNSVFKYPILMAPKQLAAGHYHLKMTAKNQQGHWTFEKDFDITASAAKKYRRESNEHREIQPIWLVALGVLGTLIFGAIIALIILIIRRHRQAK